MCLRLGHQHQRHFFAGRSCRGSRVIAALRSVRGSGPYESAAPAFTGVKIHTWHFWFCLLAGVQFFPPWWVKSMQMMPGCKTWIQYIYICLCLYILFVLRVQQDHTPGSKFTLIQHCWYWYCKYCIYSCIIYTYVFIIHVLYIYVREGKWFVHSVWLLLVGQSLSQFILNLVWNLKHFSLKT